MNARKNTLLSGLAAVLVVLVIAGIAYGTGCLFLGGDNLAVKTDPVGTALVGFFLDIIMGGFIGGGYFWWRFSCE